MDRLIEIDGIAGQLDEDWSTDPIDVISIELRILWGDLLSDLRSALNGYWSIAAEGTVSRIMGLTRIAGPIPPGEVPAILVTEGIYQRIHEALGVDAPVGDEDIRKCRDLVERHGIRLGSPS